MAISLYQFTIPALVRGLENLFAQLDKGLVFVREGNIDDSELVESRLAPDMLNLAGQIQRASDTAKFGGARLSQDPGPPAFVDNEATLADLMTRVNATMQYLRGIPASAIDGGEQREIRFKAGQKEFRFSGEDYACKFLLPNFYFHATTAYDLLRHRGVPLGKADYLGRVGQ